MRARVIGIVFMALLFALGTSAVGWWTVPIIALVVGTRERSGGPRPRDVALAAAIGWGALLAFSAMLPTFWTLLGELGAIMTLPRGIVLAVTLVFPALLAWSAAALGGVLVRTREPRPQTGDRPSARADAPSLAPRRDEAVVRR